MISLAIKRTMSPVIKRSVVLNRHKTSVSLEDPFWEALNEIAQRTHVPLARLLEQIDQGRKGPNLSSALRTFVLTYFQSRKPPRTANPPPSVVLEKLEDIGR